MAKIYIGKAALTMVRTDGGGYAYVHQGDPAPTNLDVEDRKRLVKEGFLEAVDVNDAEPADASAAPADSKPSTVEDILKAVGDDKALAQQYLDEEKAAEKPRSTLVEKLQVIATPSGS